jgi:hypothetical protein
MATPLDGKGPECLEDWDYYSRLNQRRMIVTRYWYVSAVVPFFLGIGFLLRLCANSSQTAQNAVVGILFAWIFIVIVYSASVFSRFLFIRCPRCGWRFGPGDVCSSCGLPRNKKHNS